MKVRELPPMQAALDDLASLIPLLNDAFEAGVDFGRGQYDSLRKELGISDIPYDPWYFSHSVRHFVRLMLSREGLSVQDWRPDDVPLSGLRFTYRNWFIRARKATKQGELPAASGSKALQSHYQQMLPGDFGTYSGRNLVILWRATPGAGYQGISIIYPLGGDPENPAVFWRRDFAAREPVLRRSVGGEIDAEVLGDLDMELTTGMDEEGIGEEHAL